MTNLAMLLMMRGELSEAETWAQIAAEFGSVRAMNVLGIVTLLQGGPGEAETWWRKASELGEEHATTNLRDLLQAKREGGTDGLRNIRDVQWHHR